MSLAGEKREERGISWQPCLWEMLLTRASKSVATADPHPVFETTHDLVFRKQDNNPIIRTFLRLQFLQLVSKFTFDISYQIEGLKQGRSSFSLCRTQSKPLGAT
jgi:hypothetical protein